MTLHTEVHGSGPTLVVLPSFSLDGHATARAFEPVLERYGDWARVYVDLPGTGRSPGGDPTSDAVLAAVADTVDAHTGGGPFAVAGWSYGGYLGLGLVRRFQDRVTGALLACTGTRIRSADRDLSGTFASAAAPGWLDRIPEHLHGHLRQAVGRQTAEVAGRVAELIAGNAATDERFLELLRGDGFALRDEHVATTTDRPVVVLAGRRDRVAGYRNSLEMATGLPRGDVLLSATAGHYLPLEEPDLLAAGAARLAEALGEA